MAIASSAIVADDAQRDGRRRVRVLHIDHVGVQYPFVYLCAAGFDASAALASGATQLAADITAAEVAANIGAIVLLGSLASVSTTYSTVAQNVAALRAAFISATERGAVMIGDFLASKTDAQLQAAFGMTAAQVTALRSRRLTPAASAAATLRASVGE